MRRAPSQGRRAPLTTVQERETSHNEPLWKTTGKILASQYHLLVFFSPSYTENSGASPANHGGFYSRDEAREPGRGRANLLPSGWTPPTRGQPSSMTVFTCSHPPLITRSDGQSHWQGLALSLSLSGVKDGISAVGHSAARTSGTLFYGDRKTWLLVKQYKQRIPRDVTRGGKRIQCLPASTWTMLCSIFFLFSLNRMEFQLW